MFFEGSEKKVEVVTAPEAGSLRKLGKAFWSSVVSKAQADILDIISNEHCDAYLLSESSLFVWHDRFLMLTCGTTTLVDALLHFLDQVSLEHIRFTSYQRKNEYQSHLQKSSFDEDIDRLRQRMDGKAFRLGHLDSHHNYVFHLDKSYQPETDDSTNEMLMYHIKGPNADYFRCSQQTVEGIRERLQLDTILPGFQISDWLFEPFGYSVNAIKGDRYATFHITPQEDSSYVSFETNLDLEQNPIVPVLLGALNPGSWDLIGFNARQSLPDDHTYFCVSRCDLPLECGYDMSFRHYQHTDHQQMQAETL